MKCPVCKQNIPDGVVKCPHCNSRIGIVCSSCNTINPINVLSCKNCGTELLKVCPNCKSVNFPNSDKCRKCGKPMNFSTKNNKKEKSKVLKVKSKDTNDIDFEFIPQVYTHTQAFELLSENLKAKDVKIFSISGNRGCGKTTLLHQVMQNLSDDKFEWCVGNCSSITQVTPGGVIQNMLLNLFNLPDFYANEDELKKEAVHFFSNEFRFLNSTDISLFLNFLYNFKNGDYEDIIVNKRKTYEILTKIFDAFCNTGKFIFVIDNFDYIDGFSMEFFTNFVRRPNNWKNLKFIAIYEKHRPISSYFYIEDRKVSNYLDISLGHVSAQELDFFLKFKGESGEYVSQREKEVIYNKCKGNPSFVEQAISYCFDCQMSDKAFLMPNSFKVLISERLQTLKVLNIEAYKVLCGAVVLGERLNVALIREILGYDEQDFNEIIQYLTKLNYIRKDKVNYYKFLNSILWETISKALKSDTDFEEMNVKIGRAISVFTLNTNPILAIISHNIKENRMAFDIWTKISRLSAFVGDINLYVIAQRQCLALLNEFNENETLNIRYNISERLGKLLTEYQPADAIEFLPDAIANAKSNNDEVKEIELLGYLATCCKKVGNYYGDIECVDNVLKKLSAEQRLEIAMLKSTKLQSLLYIGNSGEVVSLVDNDIAPVLDEYIAKPRLNKLVPFSLLYDTLVKVYLCLAIALVIQGNDRVFEVLTLVFDVIDKHKISDIDLICASKLTLAFANTMKGNFSVSKEVLSDVANSLGVFYSKNNKFDEAKVQFTNYYNLIETLNNFLLHNYDGLRESLFENVTYANNSGDEFSKNIFKIFLGKLFCDDKQAKHAIKIYDEQVTYFANKKLAIGALLSWFLISEATIITESPNSAIDIANQALEIAQNPKINNYYFIALLKVVLAKAYVETSDYETAQINLESALSIAKKYNMNDLASKIYYLYGKYFFELGSVDSQKQLDYLRRSDSMFNKSLDYVVKYTKNTHLRDTVNIYKEKLMDFCNKNSLPL